MKNLKHSPKAAALPAQSLIELVELYRGLQTTLQGLDSRLQAYLAGQVPPVTPPPPSSPRMTELMEAYISSKELLKRESGTLKSYQEGCRIMASFLQVKQLETVPVNGLPPTTMRDFHQWLIRRGYATPTIARILNFVKSVLRYGLSVGLVTDGRLLHYKVDNSSTPVPQPLPGAELLLLYTAPIPAELQVIADLFWLNVDTGFHFIDFIKLTERCIFTDEQGNQYLRQTRQKTGTLAVVPYTAAAQQLASKYGGLDKVPFPKYNNYYNRSLKDLAAAVGIQSNLTACRARDTFANYYLNEMGYTLEGVALMLGHSDTSHVRKYARLNESRLIHDLTAKVR